jgi:histidinol phosphatase-like enzyme (inositol monophosphatase family)
MSPRLAFALDAVTRAGRLTLAHFQTGVAFDTKADQSPVTVADHAAERLLREAIGQAFPGEHVLGEEEGGDPTIPDRWVIDPIDGTKSFVSGVPLYGTLLAYEENFVPVLGAIYFPALNDLHFAERGSGAFWNGRPSRVSSLTRLEGAVVCCGGHKSMAAHGRDRAFLKIAERTMATRTWGDAYGHMLVATGRVEAMIDPVVSRWDLSAVQVIVEESGGRFTDFSGGPALTGTSGLEAISSNGKVHEELLRAFAG